MNICDTLKYFLEYYTTGQYFFSHYEKKIPANFEFKASGHI